MKGLVRIRDLETTDAALLTPSHAYFLRENLKLRLLAARVALLARDELSFRDDLRPRRRWLTRYFDAKAKPTVNALATVEAARREPGVDQRARHQREPRGGAHRARGAREDAVDDALRASGPSSSPPSRWASRCSRVTPPATW